MDGNSRLNEPIAVIGSACRFAGGVGSPSQLWELLKQPRDVLNKIPESRFHADGFYHADGVYHGHSHIRSSYMLDQHPGAFDAKFFRIIPAEAKAIDPQQRILLEVIYEGLESAGLSIHQLRGSKTGVYAGLMTNDYENMLAQDFDTLPIYHGTGTSRAIAANRVSYFFDWKGPSFTIDTACSSSLYAIHLAAQALRSGEADTAIACGSNVILGPNFYIFLSNLNMLSPDCRSKMWDEGANGYGRGEGVAVVVLKTLRAAIRDGDDIECIIRETGLNQDGATSGITMPSVSSQAALIRDVYTKAGLDPLKEGPQFFEAHGTGTPAGDSIEAEAIHRSLIPSDPDSKRSADGPVRADPLYVGSIKTVLGHTESSAGVAAVLKASLALQHGTIPPNLLFTRLSPRVAPFYGGLHLPTVAKAWPDVGEGQPRRASVNSFGFGGANAHAILESFDSPGSNNSMNAQTFGPYVFSADTEHSLVRMLEDYSEFLGSRKTASPPLSARDLAWTLRSRRSVFPFKAALPAGSIDSLKARLDAKLQDYRQTKTPVGIHSSIKRPQILGVFTGQGAQYARMGAELLETSPAAQALLRSLEDSLAQLPESHRPTWSLSEELLRADSAGSRVGEAALSQPLCTALQIIVVDLLKYAGVTFSGVIGHSSGEIAAAYAAGYITASDALRIAYYRGRCVALAQSPNGTDIRGAMLAVGTSMDDVNELLREPEFNRRAWIAAYNSSSSVTISGDEDAMGELETIYREEKKFCRRLPIDKAYHSSHMLACSDPYLQSLRNCRIQVQAPSTGTVWYSTVHEGAAMSSPDMIRALCDGTYWSDNLTRPVLFHQGLQRALKDETDLVLEVGPHAALKGPSMQTIKETLTQPVLYHGTLIRKTNAVEALSSAVGFLWSQQQIQPRGLESGEVLVDLDRYEEGLQGQLQHHWQQTNPDGGHTNRYSLVKGLPSYPWDHSKVYWHEPRQTRALRHRKDPVHPLLGHLCPDSAAHQMSWRHILRTREVSWLTEHRLQGKPVFPAAGYISSMMEASRLLPPALSWSDSIRLVEATDFVVHRAMVFDEAAGDGGDDMGIETLVSMLNVTRNDDRVRARFTYSASLDLDQSMSLVASANVIISLGEPSAELLHPRGPRPPNMIPVGQDSFFDSLAKIGYGYSGPFRAASGLKRCLGEAEATINSADVAAAQEKHRQHGHAVELAVHPGILDSALQTLLLAMSHPGDGQLWSVFIPVRFDCIRMNPLVCASAATHGLTVMATVKEMGHHVDSGFGFTGDVDMFAGFTANAAIQIQGVALSPFAPASAADDEKMFAHMRWGPMGVGDGDITEETDRVSTEQRELSLAVERLVVYNMRKLDAEIPSDHPARSDATFGHFLNLCRHVTALVDAGKHKYAPKEWAGDLLDNGGVLEDCARFSDTIDVEIVRTLGEVMPRVLNGETTVLEHLFPSGLMARYYTEALGQSQSLRWVGRAVEIISHRYPRMDILEVGAGTGGATRGVLQHVGHDGLRSYTFTDVSTSFLEEAKAEFSGRMGFGNRINYRALDVSGDPIVQGFKPGSYDLIIASYVIHATPSLEQTMRGLRKLLRPGGFVVIAEMTNLDLERVDFVFGTLPGMWAGVAEGRTLTPYVRPARWDAVLKSTGFSGVDVITPDEMADVYVSSVFVTQAVDDHVAMLREPLLAPLPALTSDSGTSMAIRDLVIVGGATETTRRLVEELSSILGKWCIPGPEPGPGLGPDRPSRLGVSSFSSLTEVRHGHLTPQSVVLSLTELDKPLFDQIVDAEFDALKQVVSSEKTLLWITRDRRAGNPWSNLTVGFLRSAKREVPELRVQCVDFETQGDTTSPSLDAHIIASLLLSLQYSINQNIPSTPVSAAGPDSSGQSGTSSLLWTVEPEIIVDSRGRRLIPRFEAMKEANDRYNSARREVTKSVNPAHSQSSVAIRMEGQGHVVVEEVRPPLPLPLPLEPHQRNLKASHALLWPIDTPLGPRFLSIGSDPNSEPGPSSGSQYLILSQSLASVFTLSEWESKATSTVAVPFTEAHPHDPESMLALAAAHIWSSAILDSILPGQNLLVHNPSPVLATVLSHRATSQRVNVRFSTDTHETAACKSWIHLPSHMPKRKVHKLLAASELSACVVFQFDPTADAAPLLSLLPPHCRIQRINLAISYQACSSSNLTAMQIQGDSSSVDSETTLGRMLSDILQQVRIGYPSQSQPVKVTLLKPTDLVSDTGSGSGMIQPSFHDPLAVMHWSDTVVQVRVSRLDAVRAGPLFKRNKTYWLVGLTSNLGLSICDWMIGHGATHVVLSSRSPKIEEAWLRKHHQNGIVVKVVSLDVASKSSVEAAHATIISDTQIPSLGGVMNGAMVLRDAPIRNMTLDDLTAVLGPKVCGSMHLDHVLGDTDLDFFVFFSSIVNLVGNLGQANYCAANAFMSGLAAHRHRSGLAASVINIGAVAGAGYITRELGDDGSARVLELAGQKRVSEGYVHQLLAETIVGQMVRTAYVAGSGSDYLDGRGYEPEIGTAMNAPDATGEIKPVWYGDPKFVRFVPDGMADDGELAGAGGQVSGSIQNGGMSVKDRLLLAKSSDDVLNVVTDTILFKLRAVLLMESDGASGVDDDAMMRMRSNHMGIDSLVAVNLRSWLLKQFQVSVPTLEILNGISVSEMVDQVVLKLPSGLVPNVQLAESETQAATQAATPSETSSETPPAPLGLTERSTNSSLAAMTADTNGLAAQNDEDSKNVTREQDQTLLFERSVPLSFSQDMFWVVQTLVQDKTTLNHTLLFHLTGQHIQVGRLRAAVSELGQRHEALRTCFLSNEQGQMQQGVLGQGTLKLEHIHISSQSETGIPIEAAVTKEFERLKAHVYDLASGHVMRFILLTTPVPTRSYIITGAHHLVIDGLCLPVFLGDIQTAYQREFEQASSHPNNVNQYAEFATEQRAALASGVWDADMEYWQQAFISGPNSTLPEPLSLRRARVAVRRPLVNYHVHTCDFTIPPDLARRIRAVARAQGATPFHFYLAAFRVFLYRLLFCDDDRCESLADADICIGIADANRKDEDVWGSVGPYMNLLPLRFPPQQQTGQTGQRESAPFTQVLDTARETTLAALMHSAPAFQAILQHLRVERAVDHAPLFQAFLDYRQGWHTKQSFLDCETEIQAFEPGRTPYDLSLDIIDNSASHQETVVTFMGQSALYDSENVSVFARCYQDVLREFSDRPDGNVNRRDWVFPGDDVASAMPLGRGPDLLTTLAASASGTLVHRVESYVQTRDYREKKAIIIAGEAGPLSSPRSITYHQLWKRVALISDHLRRHGIGPGQFVAVYQEATANFVCSMLAAMAVGAAYVPLEPNDHVARLGKMVADCKPAALLVDSRTRDRADELIASLSDLGAPAAAVMTTDVSKLLASRVTAGLDWGSVDLPIQASPEKPAAVLYTSGTTGTPKGVVLNHYNLAHEVEETAVAYGLDSAVVVLQQSAAGFDMAVQEVLVALAHGGTLCIIPHDLRGDPEAVASAISGLGVTFTCATPTEYQSWLRYMPSQLRQSAWKVAVSGGEPATESLLKRFRELGKADLRFFNCYGPTETTCCSARLELDYRLEGLYDSYRVIPAGTASPNEHIYIVDEQMRPLPAGLPGEIVIGGVGVAAGYLHDEAKTSEAFIPDVFTDASPGTDAERNLMYRTRDRGRLLSNGWLSVEGRIDQDTLIKLRGVRIDLQDIEQTILRSAPGGAISDAVASVRSGSGSGSDAGDWDSDFVVAHVTFNPDTVFPEDGGMHVYLSRLLASLPLSRSMRPSIIVPVDRLPLTSSGKLDRKAVGGLPVRALTPAGNDKDSSLHEQQKLTTVERSLKEIWEHILIPSSSHSTLRTANHVKFDDIVPSSNFFHVGGTSMLLLEVRARIRQQHGISIPLVRLFENSTLGSMAYLVEKKSVDAGTLSESAPEIDSDRSPINWEDEARLSQGLEDEIRASQVLQDKIRASPKKGKGGRVIVLTGAAGNLGRHILRLLLALPDVKKVICVAVRNVEQRVAAGILPAGPTLRRKPSTASPPPPSRVVYYPGDLSQPRVGLSEHDFAFISGQVDAAIHVGADVSHARTYMTLRDANVAAVRELVRLCLPRRAAMHFVSSGEVAMLGHGNGGDTSAEDRWDPPWFEEKSVVANGVVPSSQDAVREGYAASKWVAERFLENVCTTAPELRVWIHRPSSIMDAHSLSPRSKGNASEEEDIEEMEAYYKSRDAPLLQSFLYYSRKLHLVPAADRLLRGSLDLVSMERVAEEIVQSALSGDHGRTIGGDNPGNVGVSEVSIPNVVYRHHVGDQEIPLGSLGQYLEGVDRVERVTELPYKTVSLIEWTASAKSAGLHPLLVEFFETISREKRVFSFPKFVKG